MSSPLLGGLVARAAVVKATARANFNEVNFDVSCLDVFFVISAGAPSHLRRRRAEDGIRGHRATAHPPSITVFLLGFHEP